ncbi:MAG: formimidoylglutamase [Bacteroidales bacterium]|jgi:arginase family enzyme|nr:formimidoylglutamase [Bacteroidales bacterium]
MDIKVYFNSVDTECLGCEELSEDTMFRMIQINSKRNPFEMDLSCVEADIAIVGVGEESDLFTGADIIRKQFYALKQHRKRIKIVDLGNIKIGKTQKDTYSAMADVCSCLLQNRVIPLILAKSNDLAIGNYMAYEQIGQIINVFNLDSEIDFKEIKEEIDETNYLTYMFCNQPNYLFNYTHAAYQSYFVVPELIDLMDQMRFETYRLGAVQNKIEFTEPLIRNADMVIADVNSIRASDAPSSQNPHGLYGEEFCKIVNFAGMSDKLTSIGFYGYRPEYDTDFRTAKLVSHAMWYFIEGYNWRKNDFPYKDQKNYYKFSVLMPNDINIVFYKSKKSERWWMQVSCPDELQEKYLRHFLIPCTYDDYKEAMEGQLPERWLLAYNKLNL